MSDLIKALKDNEKPFCLLSNEMRKLILDCSTEDLEYLSSNSKSDEPEWLENKNTVNDIINSPIDTYRLRRDYEAKPSEVECEIKSCDGHLNFDLRGQRHSLHQAADEVDFLGFDYEGMLWGRLYKWKQDGSFHTVLRRDRLDQYEVCDMAEAKVLFKGESK